MAASSGPPGSAAAGPGGRYVAELTEASRLIAERVGGGSHPWELVYQSRSGPPAQPWLEPDVLEYLGKLAESGAPAAVIIPAGFVSDHMEVKHDLDTEAAETAADLGLPVARAATPWYHPRFRAMVTDLVRERISVPDEAGGSQGSPGRHGAEGPVPRLALGRMGPSSDVCPPGCCVHAAGAGARETGAA
jgi:ferrochelatase